MTNKNLNWSVIGVSAGIALLLGFFIHALFHKCPEIPVINNRLVDSLIVENAIKEGKIAIRDSIIKANDKQQFIHDSVIINNHKALKNDYEKIKNFTADSRAAYIDSIFRRANIRK